MPDQQPVSPYAPGFAGFSLAAELLNILVDKGIFTKSDANSLLERAARQHDAPAKENLNADTARLLRTLKKT